MTCLDIHRHVSPDCDNTTKPDARTTCHLHPCNDGVSRSSHAPGEGPPTPASPIQPNVVSSSPVDDEGTEGEVKSKGRVSFTHYVENNVMFMPSVLLRVN